MTQKRVFSPMPPMKTSGMETKLFNKYPSACERTKSTIYKYKSIHNLAQASISDNYVPEKCPDLFCRPFLWKSILLNIEIVKGPQKDQLELNLSNLRKSRSAYNNLLKTIAPPWHLLNPDSVYYKGLDEVDNIDQGLDVSETTSGLQRLGFEHVISGEDPLSSNSKSKRLTEKDVDILNMIITDVERLFPDFPKMFIESIEDKKEIIEILYRYSKICDKGYIQGMHEICGIIYVILHAELTQGTQTSRKDSIIDQDITDDIQQQEEDPSKLDEQINEFLLEDYFPHDVYSTFDAFITPLLDKYFSSSGVVQESILFGIKIRHIDPVLEEALRRVGVVGGHAQVWLSRWFRMLGTREIGVKRGIRLWDGLISYAGLSTPLESSTLTNVTTGNQRIDVSKLFLYAVILLLLRMRTELLIAAGADPTIAASVPMETSQNLSGMTSSKLFNQKSKTNIDIDDTDVLFLLLHYPENAMGSVSELIADAATLALVERDDKELRVRGASIVEKCSSMRGVLGGVVLKPSKSDIEKNSKASPWSGMLKRASGFSKSWSKPASEMSNKDSTVTKNIIDADRIRLESRLQQRVREKLSN